MDYKEYLVKRKKGAAEIALAVLIYLVAFAIAVACVSFLNIGGIQLLLAVAIFFGGYKLSVSFNREYEYTVTENFVDVDVIYNATNRKRLISFSMKDVLVIAPVKSDEYNKIDALGDYKKIDASTRRKDADVYFAAVEKNGKFLVKIELPKDALEHLRKYAPSKVIIK